MHLKRQQIPKSWPISRKGTKYIVRSRFDIQKGIPILIILRDILKLTQNRKEAKRAINSGKILLNNRKIRDEKNPALLFDVITIVPAKKYYRLTLTERGKFSLEEIKENEANYKVSKIVNKKILKGKKTQLNLYDGRNVLSEDKNKTGDSVLINLKEKKIEKNLLLKEKAKAIAIGGKHAGIGGIIEKVNKEDKRVLLKINSKKISILIKQIMVIENGRK